MSDAIEPTPAAETETAVEPVEAAPKKRRGFGVTALVLALLAVAGDVLTVVIGVNTIGGFNDGMEAGLGLLVVFLGWGAIALVVGLVLAAISLLLAIIGLAVGSGRVAAVFALLIDLGVIIGHGALLALIAAAGSSVGSFVS